MGHFALVVDGVVRNIAVISNAVMDDLPFPDSEPIGQAFISTLPELAGQPGNYWQCSYNANFRGCYPGVGYTFDGTVFAPPAIEEI